MCNFFNEYQHSINDYTWFIKIRPDMIINELTDMKLLIPGKINTRARVYLGPKKVLFGSSIGGDGCYSGIKDNFFSEKEDLIVIDDWFIAFDKSVVEKGVFKIYDKDEINDDLYQQYHVDLNNGKIIKGSSHNKYEHEWFHSNLMSKRGATFNVIGLDMTVKGRLNGSGMRSGHIL